MKNGLTEAIKRKSYNLISRAEQNKKKIKILHLMKLNCLVAAKRNC